MHQTAFRETTLEFWSGGGNVSFCHRKKEKKKLQDHLSDCTMDSSHIAAILAQKWG